MSQSNLSLAGIFLTKEGRMKVFIEHAFSGYRADQLGYWTLDKGRWHDFKVFLAALQLCAQRNLANAQILVIQDDGLEVRLDLPSSAEFDIAYSYRAMETPPATLQRH